MVGAASPAPARLQPGDEGVERVGHHGKPGPDQPGEARIEVTGGHIDREVLPELTDVALERLARQIAAASHQKVSREQPLLSASLLDGSRVQVVGPPATRRGAGRFR